MTEQEKHDIWKFLSNKHLQEAALAESHEDI